MHARFLNNVLRTSILLDFRFTKNLIFHFSLPFSKGKKKYSFDARERERELFTLPTSQLEEKKKKKKLEDVQTRYYNTFVGKCATIGTRLWKYGGKSGRKDA